MSTTATLQKHYARILRLWPRDALRGITFHDAMKRRLAARILATPSVSTTAAAATGPATTVAPRLDPEAETAQMNALYSLLDNRYSKQYPCSERLLNPAFKPSYYQDLAAEMEAAPNRSWLNNKWLRWSKLVRFT